MRLKNILSKLSLLFILSAALSACNGTAILNSKLDAKGLEDPGNKIENTDPSIPQPPLEGSGDRDPVEDNPSAASAEDRSINAADEITEDLPPGESAQRNANDRNPQGQMGPSIQWIDPRSIPDDSSLSGGNGAAIAIPINHGVNNYSPRVGNEDVEIYRPNLDHTCQAQTGKIEVIMNPGNNRDLLIKEYDNFPYQNPDRSTVMRDGNNAQFKNTPVVIRCQGNIDLSQAPLRGVAPNAHAIFAYEIHASNVRDRIHGSNTRDLIYSGLGDDPVWTMGGSDRLVDMAEAGPMDQRYGQHTEEDEYIVIGE